FDERRAEWESQARGQSVITWGGTALLLFLIVAAGAMASRDYRQRERNAWIRGGESLASFRIQGAQGVEKLGEEVLSFLAEYLGAKVGAVYVHDDGDVFRRVAGHALADSADAQVVRRGESLVGQAAKDRRAMRVTDVPEGYLPVASGVGRGRPRELLIAPAVVDDEVHGVVEVGLLRAVDDADRELLDRVAETLGMAIR